MGEEQIVEVVQKTQNYWPYIITGTMGLAALFFVALSKISKAMAKRSANQYPINKITEVEEEREEEEIEETPTRNISQLLTQELDEEIYSLMARVEKIHTTSGGYVGILSDEHAKMPFFYENEDSYSDTIAGVLLHESRDNQSILELKVKAVSPFDEGTSRVLDICSVIGKINDLDYETGEKIDEEY